MKILGNGEVMRTTFVIPRSIRTDESEIQKRERKFFEKCRTGEIEENISDIINTIDLFKKDRKLSQAMELERFLYKYINDNDDKKMFLSENEVFEEEIIKRYKNWLLNCKRASNKLIDLAKCNINEENYKNMVFTTLTFSAPMEDIAKANDEFGNFIKRLNYYFRKQYKGFSLKYIAVPELHLHGDMVKKGVYSWHFHYIAFNQPWIDSKVFTDIWSKGGKGVGGFTNLRCIVSKNRRGKDTYNDLEHAINYVCKYIRKNVGDVAEISGDLKEQYYNDENYTLYEILGLTGKKKFFTSRNLNKPQEFYLNVKDTEVIEEVTELNYKKTKEVEYNSGFGVFEENKIVDIVEFEKRRVKNKASIPLLANKLENAFSKRLNCINKIYSHYNINNAKCKFERLAKKYDISMGVCYEEFSRILKHKKYLEKKARISQSLTNCQESI